MDVQHSTLTTAQQRDVMSTVLAQHNVTKERYDSSLIWYANNLKLLIRIYSHVDEELTRQFDYWGEEIDKIRDFGISHAGDTVQLWTQHPYIVMDQRRNTLRRTWSLTPDSNYMATDRLIWRMRVLNLNDGQTLVAAVSMDGGTEKNNRIAPVAFDQSSLDYRQLNDSTRELVLEVEAPEKTKEFPNTKFNLTLITDTTVNKHCTPVFIDNISLTRIHK